jgi:hypothetical protein
MSDFELIKDENLVKIYHDISWFKSKYNEGYHEKYSDIFWTYLYNNNHVLSYAFQLFKKLSEDQYIFLMRHGSRCSGAFTYEAAKSLYENCIEKQYRLTQNNLHSTESADFEVPLRLVGYFSNIADTSHLKLQQYPLIDQIPIKPRKIVRLQKLENEVLRLQITITGCSLAKNEEAFNSIDWTDLNENILKRECSVSTNSHFDLRPDDFDSLFNGFQTSLLCPSKHRSKIKHILSTNGFEIDK